MAKRGACVVKRRAYMVNRACVVKGGMCGEGGHAWQRGACMAKGVCMEKGVCAWHGGTCGGEHAWQERWLLQWMVCILLECIPVFASLPLSVNGALNFQLVPMNSLLAFLHPILQLIHHLFEVLTPDPPPHTTATPFSTKWSYRDIF